MNKWKTLSSKLAFDNPWFRVRQDSIELPSGKIIDDYFMWQDNDVAQMVPITKEGKFILDKQYKHAVGQIMTEFPAGYFNENEKPEEAARRELLEETGYTAEKFTFLGKLNHNPTKEIGNLYIFLVENAYKKEQQHLDETENIELVELTMEEIIEKIQNHEIWATGTISAFFLALQKLGYKNEK
ncbi:MAG TPA: NUDIX hydrolase [Patescibacteria group bacterium]|nr:NUDIX hydrolase [Patescibacteria group bacterium]